MKGRGWSRIEKGLILGSIAGVIWITGWVVTMPYPLDRWLAAREGVVYSEDWTISRGDFRAALSLARKELEGREIITFANLISPTELEFTTLEYYRGPLASSGRTITIRKSEGEWKVRWSLPWIS